MNLLYALWFPTVPSPPFVSLNGFPLSAAYFLVSCWFSFLFFQVSFPMRCLWELYALDTAGGIVGGAGDGTFGLMGKEDAHISMWSWLSRH